MNAYARGYSLTRIGAIVLVGVALFTASFIYMTNRSLTQRRATLFVRIATAEGLKKGDQVLHRGVQVGEVRRIDFAGDGGVVVNVKVTETLPLHDDASAAMVAADIFGRQVLVLRDGTSRGALADGDTVAGFPPTTMTARMEDLGRSAQRIIGDTTTLLLHQSLRAIANLSGELATLTRQSQTVLARQADELHGITGRTTVVLENIATASAPERLAPITDNLAIVTARLDTTVVAFRDVAAQLKNPHGTTGRLLSDPALFERMTGSLGALEALLTDLRANPKRYINVSVF